MCGGILIDYYICGQVVGAEGRIPVFVVEILINSARFDHLQEPTEIYNWLQIVKVGGLDGARTMLTSLVGTANS